jgi:hypothetical protein
MSMSKNLHSAKRAKNNEFYTRLEDIEKELKHYEEHFRGKVVYCNCDDPAWSNFPRYFKDNFDGLGIKKLLTSYYDPTTGSGDFRSQECVDLLKQADIVVTNPPFSLFREYIAQLVEHEKKFLVVGNMNAITYKEVFPLIKDNKMWLGITAPKVFVQPDGEEKKFGNICWFTNLTHRKRNEELPLYRKYNKKDYPKYDNYDAINVNKTKEIPEDYDGVMGVPISWLDKYNPEQFEIMCIDREISYGVLPELKNKKSKGPFGRGYIGGKEIYARILIRRKTI